MKGKRICYKNCSKCIYSSEPVTLSKFIRIKCNNKLSETRYIVDKQSKSENWYCQNFIERAKASGRATPDFKSVKNVYEDILKERE